MFDESDFAFQIQDARERAEPEFGIYRTKPRADGTGDRRRVVLLAGRGAPKGCFHGKPLEPAVGSGAIFCGACDWEADRIIAAELEPRWL